MRTTTIYLVRHAESFPTADVPEPLAGRHPGETIALASHGNALALYLGTIDPSFGYAQWRAMRNPDLFRVTYQAGRASWDGTRLPTSA